MTWVIGMPFMFGYGLLISDIRVSWPNGVEHDCLQKVYPLCRFVVGAFAGSVFAGFAMIENMRKGLRGAPADHAVIPRWLAQRFPRSARRIWKKLVDEYPAIEKQGCHLLMTGASPTEDVGIPGMAKCWVWRMRDPDFEPEYADMNRAIAIGSGVRVQHYQEALDEFKDDDATFPLVRMEMAGQGGFGNAMLHVVSKVVEDHPVSGVSKHLHLCLVRRGAISIQPNDRTEYPGGGRKIEIRMPPVADSYDKFVQASAALGLSAAEATC